MNKREAFRRALIDTKHRKHMRKSGKHWLVRGVTALTLGLMIAQPVVSVAAVVDAGPQTEAPASEAPTVEEEAPATEVATPEEAPVEENMSEPAAENNSEGVTKIEAPEASLQAAPEAEQELGIAEEPVIVESGEKAEGAVSGELERVRTRLTVSNLETVYGDNFQTFTVTYLTQDGTSHTDELALADVEITDREANSVDTSTHLDVGTYQISIKPEVLDRFDLDPAETDVTPGELVVTPKQVEVKIYNVYIRHGNLLRIAYDMYGLIAPDQLDVSIADGQGVKDLPVGRHILTWELDSFNGEHLNYEMATSEFEVIILPSTSDELLSIGSKKDYDGTSDLPDDMISMSEFLPIELTTEDLQFRDSRGGEWTNQAPIEVGHYEVRVEPARVEKIQKELEENFVLILTEECYVGDYHIYKAQITDEPEKEGDLFLQLPSGKQFDGTPKLGAEVANNLDLDYQISEEHLMYRALAKATDDEEELPFASREATGWQMGTPTEVGEYELTLRDEVVADILEAHPNHELAESAKSTIYTIVSGDDTENNTGGNTGGSNTGGNGGSNGSNTGNTGSTTTTPTPDSIAYVSQTSGHTLPLAMTNSQADGTLPSTGQRNQTLLSMLGMTLLGTLGLAGWYKRHQAK